MKLQFEHLVMSSVKGWVEHTLLKEGEAFTPYSGYLYDVQDIYNGLYTYALPFQPIVADASIENCPIMSGVFLDGVFITPGSSGLVDINFEKGHIYFSSGIGNSLQRLSGNYSVAEFNVKLTDQPEESLLIETKHEIKPQAGRSSMTGLQPNEVTFPVIYLKNYGGNMDPFAFGGMDKQIINVRMIVLADSQFTADAVGSIFKEQTRTIIPLITGIDEMPFNNYGGYANGVYNYTGLFANRTHRTNSIWIDNIDVSSLDGANYNEIRKLNPHVFVRIIDLGLEAYRNPRQT